MPTRREKDEVTGTETTGHEWDGIKELDKPLPRWWLWLMWATVIFSVVYWVLYPAWPGLEGYTRGILGWSQRGQLREEMAEARARQAEFVEAIRQADLAEIVADPRLLNFAIAGGEAAFGDNCAPCHGSGAEGGPGFPNLNDDAWLWGGTLEAIHTTILYGIRSRHPDTRYSEMPAFREFLEPATIEDAAEYVLSLSGRADDAAAAERGAQIFVEQCSACHGEDAQGMDAVGAPNLTDPIWLYGGDRSTILQTIRQGRRGVMPAWTDRLEDVTIKELAVYVHSLGGGE